MNDSQTAVRRGPMPPAFLLIAILLMLGLHILLPVAQLVVFPWRMAGAALVAIGVALNLWAFMLFKQAGATVKPFEPSMTLVLKGPFAFSRNPMYLGMLLTLAGIAVALGSATPWLVVPWFVWLVARRFIVVEESKLESAFGNHYIAYKEKVRRWL
ncbi:MAG: isoprenylcysteine carboxylmethyltransferase family protein [Methylomonas sp.]|jgi:protein-S-isoprenylcysteine O-methyltransferase Ste14